MKYEIRIGQHHGDLAASTLFQSRDAYRDLLGICEGLLADGEINAIEAAYLKNWIQRHPEHHNCWPFPDLTARLDAIFADGIVTPDERHELTEILKSLLGPTVVHSDARLPGSGMAGPTQLVFDTPAPEVLFQSHEFCVTGVFAYGRRNVVEKAILTRGGLTVKAPRSITRYVLVGSFVSPGWANGNFGTKIERALELRKNGASVAIVCEEHWKRFL